MAISKTIEAMRRAAGRATAEYARVRAERPELQGYEDAPALLDALDARSTLDVERKGALVAVLLEEHRRGRHPLWSQLLFCTFGPMLLALRSSIGRPKEDDADQLVLEAFTAALASVVPTRFAPVALRRATAKPVFADERLSRDEPEHVAFAEELHPQDAPVLEELLDLHLALRSAGAEHAELLASIAADETLGELVARRSAGLGADEREALHGRLRRARGRVLAEAQTRLDADRAA